MNKDKALEVIMLIKGYEQSKSRLLSPKEREAIRNLRRLVMAEVLK